MKTRRLMMLSLALFCFILMNGCSSSPSPSDAEKALSQQIDSESGGQIKLVNFKKTDGQKFEMNGIQGYNMDYEAEIEFEATAIWLDHDVENNDNNKLIFILLLNNNVYGGVAVQRGNHVKIAGVMTGEKKESGWKFKAGNSHLISDVSRILSQVDAMNVCINNLRQIDAAANQFALENKKVTGDPINFPNDLTPYIRLTPDGKIPSCPAGGIYTIKKVGDIPTCSIPSHVLP